MIAKVRGEMPDVTADATPVGALEKMTWPQGAVATTRQLTGTVTYDPEALSQLSPEEQENTFAHEFTHSRQITSQPWYSRVANLFSWPVTDAKVPEGYTGSSMQSPYFWRPAEQEAFQAERNRALAQHQSVPDPVTRATDIQLPLDGLRKARR